MDEMIISKELEAKLQAAQTIEDVIKVCAEEGIELSKEQLEDVLSQYQAGENGELSEDSLDTVAGGINWLDIIRNTFPRPLPFPRPRLPKWSW